MDLLINFFNEKKMQNSMNNFETELDNLLKQYLGEEEVNRLNLRADSSKAEGNRISEMIDDFYRNQLKINIDSCNERIKIDRTITFSEKQLDPDKFCEFLLELGRLCISCGKLNFATDIFRKTKKISNKILYKAESMLELADVFSRKADWPRSLVAVSDAQILYTKINDSSGIAKCYNVLGSIFGDRGDIVKSKKYFLKGLSNINPEGDAEMAANLYTNLGIIDNIQGNTNEAKKHLKNALVLYKKLGNHKCTAEVNYNIGITFFESKDYDFALNAFDEGINIARKGRFISILCLIYLAKSQLLIAKDDVDSAAVFVDKALEISHIVDDKLTSADIFKVKGIIERYFKNYKLSESYLLNSLRINTSLKNEMNIAETSLELATLYEEIDNSKSKDPYLKSALNYYKQIDALQKVKEIELMLGIEAA